ncbi:MAG: NADP-dependent oxidoreductase [Candidatus Levybacteria bacterium]|nr:NADP-dependent oxidoreductase [Candidatus Levybacteria bacterium]
MKAAQYNTYGDSSVIEINSNAPQPVLKEGQVLVAVHAASINPFDYKLRFGYMKDGIPLSFPVTLGGDFSGIVTDVAKSVTEVQIGDAVYGQALIVNGGSGSLAEYAAANTKNISQKPKKVTFLEAASLPLVGVSAVQALEEHIKLYSGQRIVIHGGAGGIGSIAIQLAKHLGAYVITTVGTADVDFAKHLGADEVIDYKTQKFEEIVENVDAVFDTVGGETTNKSFAVLKKGGVLVSMAGQPDPDLAKQHGVTALTQSTGTIAGRLNRLAELVDQGVIKPQIDKVFPLDQAAQAFDYLEKGHPKGKVVVKIKE